MISKAGLVFVSTFLAFAKAGPLLDPNNLMNYLSKQTIDIMEASNKISTDLSKVTFILWTPENGAANPWVFNAETDPKELLDHGFDPKRDTKFISHGWNSEGIGFAKGFAEGMQKK